MELAVGRLQHVLQMSCELWQHSEGSVQMFPAVTHDCALMCHSQTYICTQVLTLNLLLERKNLGHLKFLKV